MRALSRGDAPTIDAGGLLFDQMPGVSSRLLVCRLCRAVVDRPAGDDDTLGPRGHAAWHLRVVARLRALEDAVAALQTP